MSIMVFDEISDFFPNCDPFGISQQYTNIKHNTRQVSQSSMQKRVSKKIADIGFQSGVLFSGSPKRGADELRGRVTVSPDSALTSLKEGVLLKPWDEKDFEEAFPLHDLFGLDQSFSSK